MPPIYFFLSVWGKKYCSHLVDLCIPSLLTKGNIKYLKSNKKNKFLIACPKTSWIEIKKSYAYQQLEKIIKIEKIDISEPDSKSMPSLHMGIGHLKATKKCLEDKALGVALTPDLILSNKCIECIIKYYKEGFEVLLLPAIRYEEEKLFKNLFNQGFINSNKKFNIEKKSIDLSGREMSKIAIKSFHSQTEAYKLKSKIFLFNHVIPSILFDSPKKNEGYILHCLSWMPLFIDYSKIKKHDTSAIENWTIDGDYISSNFKNYHKIHPITDFDEATVMSWAPKNDRPVKLRNQLLFFLFPKIASFLKLMNFKRSAKSKIFDNLKRILLIKPVFIHINNIDSEWIKKSIKTRKIISLEKNKYHNFFIHLLNLFILINSKLNKTLSRIFVLILAFTGNKESFNIIKNRIKKILKINNEI